MIYFMKMLFFSRQYQYFRVSADKPGIVTAKTASDAPKVEIPVLRPRFPTECSLWYQLQDCRASGSSSKNNLFHCRSRWLYFFGKKVNNECIYNA